LEDLKLLGHNKAMGLSNPQELEQRLKNLESRLLNLQKDLSVTEKIAKQIQNLVSKNRFPQLQGVEFLSRYIPGEQNRAEGFDFFLNSKQTGLWFFYFNVESYGLSSSLFQAYLLLQGRAFFDQNENTPEKALKEITQELDLKNDSRAKLFIANLHISTLKWSEASLGESPALFNRSEELKKRNDFLLQPGTRLYFLNRSLPHDFFKNLKSNTSEISFKDDFNQILFQLEKKEKNSPAPHDICFWGLEIHSNKIHLA
jgi:hypothetical protein